MPKSPRFRRLRATLAQVSRRARSKGWGNAAVRAAQARALAVLLNTASPVV